MEDFEYEKWHRSQMMAGRDMNMYYRVPTETPEHPKKDDDDKHVWVFHTLIAVVALGCLVYWGNGNQVAVEVPVADSQLIQRLQAERDQARKERDDYQRLSVQLKAMVRASNVTVAQLTDQLKALSVSVPSQPIILQAVRREAVTEKGLRQVVARNFGSEIAKRVKVIE